MKYTLNVVIAIVFALFVGHTLFAATDQHAKFVIDKNHAQVVTISHGDTLWSIASKFTPNELDIRDVIYAMKDMNNLENPTLHPGMQIKVPTIKNDLNRLPVDFDIAQN